MEKKVTVFDLDGTLADITERRKFLEQTPKDWKSFNSNIINDPPNKDIVWLLKTFHAAGNIVVISSGRTDELQEETLKWLDLHNIPFDGIFMRQADDFRKDSDVKIEMLAMITAEFGRPFVWVDDRDQVIDAIRGQGIRVMQVAPGAF